MSIYATYVNLKLPKRGIIQGNNPEWVKVTGQAVPGHIGHPETYPEGDPYTWLPPPVKDQDSLRAMVFIADGFEQKEGQRYTNDLLTLSGEEYESLSFPEVMGRLAKALFENGPCPTCNRPYEKGEWTFCSSGYHCCRDCTWKGGVRIVLCPECEIDENVARVVEG